MRSPALCENGTYRKHKASFYVIPMKTTPSRFLPILPEPKMAENTVNVDEKFAEKFVEVARNDRVLYDKECKDFIDISNLSYLCSRIVLPSRFVFT